MKDYLRALISQRKEGLDCGIPSFCTANPIVIEACLENGKRYHEYVLIEATANQVNQFGGYTGMRPADFRRMVFDIAEKVRFPLDHLILGGDHLGPLTWTTLPAERAMENAVELVQEYVAAGFQKIHLDTSMKLAGDPINGPLPDSVIAERGAILYAACESAYQALLKTNMAQQRPAYVIGSEVPIPGGAVAEKNIMEVTRPEALEATIQAYQTAFAQHGFRDAFQNIIGVVVQPGVEFGNTDYFRYDPEKARELVACAARYKNLVLEGHSTDYQPAEALREMVHDGIAILKVGPALTFALREGLFALSFMEKELIPESRRANFALILDAAMKKDPKYWEKHYSGTEEEIKLCRKYSYSDRCRYYFAQADVADAMGKLIDNMNKVSIPMNMLHQYMPAQYAKIVRGELSLDAYALVKDYIVAVADDYRYAVKPSFAETIHADGRSLK